MDCPLNPVEEGVESVNPKEQGLPAQDSSEFVKSESQAPTKPKEAILRIAQDMARILDGRYESIEKYIEPATTLHQVTFCQLVQDAMKVEKSELSDQERSQKKKGKRAREYQAEQVHGSPTKRIIRNVTPSYERGMSSGQGKNLKCPHCHEWHSGVCRVWTGGCFRCWSINHFLANCLIESRVHINPPRRGRGRSVATPSTGGRGGPNQHRGHGGQMSEIVDRRVPTALALAYDMHALEEQDAPNVITGMYSLFNN